MNKCRNCGERIDYMKYHCSKCRKELAGLKPKKSKYLCNGCGGDWYNQTKEGGCWSYKRAIVVLKDVYHSKNQVVPNPKWKLSCYH